jgi:Fur family zinc uptake transcriptional regulator
LNFLIGAGLVHRIDTLNAYFGCEAPRTDHAAQFLVCRTCHGVTELGDPTISRLLASRVRAAGFVADAPDVEIKGVCDACRSATPPHPG